MAYQVWTDVATKFFRASVSGQLRGRVGGNVDVQGRR